MGRSVNYLDNAEVVIYFHLEYQENDEDNHFQWEDLTENLISSIQNKLPSYQFCKNEWGNNETRIILANNLCNIGISEYCGLVSLSVAPIESDYNSKDALAKHHAKQIEKTLQNIVDNCTGRRLIRQGTFSNGTGVFKEVNSEGVYDNAERIL